MAIKLSPLGQRRWQNFKANTRGFYSLWIFAVLLAFSLLADVIANDKPLIVSYDGGLYFPTIQQYPETTFGGEFKTEADYRDPFVAGKIKEKGWAVWPLIPYSYNTINYNLNVPAPSPPSIDNWLGTDDQGRDVLARLIHGFRISVLFGILTTFFCTSVGIAAGAIQGYFGGMVDLLFQRFVEIWGSMPQLYMFIIMSSLVQPNFWWLLALVLLFNWMHVMGVVRAEFLRARNLDYVKAARALGATNITIMVKHILPNALVATLTYLPFVLSGAITTLTALDFLGFGLPPGSPALGELLSQGKNNLQAPWLGITAFIILSLLLSLLVFIGEAVRDAFDPRKNKVGA